jgi:flavin reductase (DIM6/NTAB) family NADH-FMN oxidoreductase RutF
MMKELNSKYLSYPQGIFVVCSYDKQRKPNLMTVTLGGMCSHKPPSFFVSIRPACYSYQNIQERRAFTVNVPSSDYLREVDYVGLVSGSKTDKFSVCGLTAVESESVDAPYIEEFPTHAECKLSKTVDLGTHTMFIGEIVCIRGKESVLTDISLYAPNAKDVPDMVKAKGIVYAATGDHRYYCSLGEPLEKSYTIGRQLID